MNLAEEMKIISAKYDKNEFDQIIEMIKDSANSGIYTAYISCKVKVGVIEKLKKEGFIIEHRKDLGVIQVSW